MSVAILLEHFIDASEAEEQAKRNLEIKEYQDEHAVQHPLEPLLRKLIKGYVDEADLEIKLKGLFEARTQPLSHMNLPINLFSWRRASPG